MWWASIKFYIIKLKPIIFEAIENNNYYPKAFLYFQTIHNSIAELLLLKYYERKNSIKFYELANLEIINNWAQAKTNLKNILNEIIIVSYGSDNFFC